MGTLCKNCPMRGKKSENENCMTLFAKKYMNSCTVYDASNDGKTE